MSSRKSRRGFRPRLEALEGRDAPALLVITQTPTLTPNGNARDSAVITPFDYGMAWDGHAEVAPPSGAASGFYPGDFTWAGVLELTVQPEAGEAIGTPVHITLSSGGTITWDLDPKSAGGFTTSTVTLSAGLEGQPNWFDLSGGQSDPNNHAESNDFLNGSGFEQLDTTIGGTIRIVVSGTGSSASWVMPDGSPRGTVFNDFGAGYYMPPDVVAGPISFNPNGGVDFQYSVQFQSLVGANPMAQLFWGDNNGPTGDAIYTEDIPLARGTYNRHLNAIVPPPSAATRLWLVVDAEQVTDEQSFDNNQSSQAFTNAVVFTGAKYDGDAQPNVVGRFFSGISVPGQFYTVQITQDLASFVSDAKQVVVKVGTTALTAMRSDPGPGWDHRTFVTSTHDVGLLTRDTPVTVTVTAAGRTLATATQTIDVEPLPAWLMNVKPLNKAFDTGTTTYTFSGALLNLTTGARTGPGSFIPLGLGGANRVDVTASMTASASLDPTRADLLTFNGNGHAKGWYYGRQLFDVTGNFPSGGPFNSNVTLDPRTLALTSGNVTFNLTGGQVFADIMASPEYAKGNFRITPHVDANVSYSVAMTAKFLADGRLDPNLSGLDFDFQGQLSGTIKPKINLGSTLDAALWTLQNTLGTPKSVIDQIRNDLRGTRGVPTVDISATVSGELDATASVKFGGAGLNASTSLRSWHGLLDLVPSVSYTVTWSGGTYLSGVSSFLSKYFTIHTVW